MNIIGATAEEKKWIKQILSDYPDYLTVVEVKDKMRLLGGFYHQPLKIELKRRPDIKDFVGTLLHETKHYEQYLTKSVYSERKAQEFQVMKLNEIFNEAWILKPAYSHSIIYKEGKRTFVKRRRRYDTVFKAVEIRRSLAAKILKNIITKVVK